MLLGWLLAMAHQPQEALAMGKWLEKQLTGDAGDEFWKNVEKAMPLIKQNADAALQRLGHNHEKLSGVVFVKGEGGDEVWTVKYKYGAATREDLLGKRGDLEVYLNNRGIVKRIVKFEQDQEQIIYGKDERIAQDMTPEQVRERLGEPDHIGKPPRELRDVADQMWTYKTSTTGRTMRIEVYFKDGKVFSFSRTGE